MKKKITASIILASFSIPLYYNNECLAVDNQVNDNQVNGGEVDDKKEKNVKLQTVRDLFLTTNLQVHDTINNHCKSFIFKDQSKGFSNTNDVKPEFWGESSYSNKEQEGRKVHSHQYRDIMKKNTAGVDLFNNNFSLGLSFSKVASDSGRLEDKKEFESTETLKENVFSVNGSYKINNVFLAQAILSLNDSNLSIPQKTEEKHKSFAFTTSVSHYQNIIDGLTVVKSAGFTRSSTFDLDNTYKKKSITSYFANVKFSLEEMLNVGEVKISPFVDFRYKLDKKNSSSSKKLLGNHQYNVEPGAILEYGCVKFTLAPSFEFKKKYNGFQGKFGINFIL